MDYAFQFKVENKAAAKQAVAVKFDEAVVADPALAPAHSAMLANANAVIDLLVDDATQDVGVSCSGHVGCHVGGRADDPHSNASIKCHAAHTKREEVEAESQEEK